jgi:membrane protein
VKRLRATLHNVLRLLKEAFDHWQADNAPRLGAALAYYTLFSLAPLLIIAIAIAGFAFGHDAAQGRIVEELRGLVGPVGAQAVEELIRNSRKPEAGLVATLLGLLTLFLGATGVFTELKNALNDVWDVKAPSQGLWGMIRTRLAAFALVLVVGFLLLVSLVVSAALSAAETVLDGMVPTTTLQLLNAGLSLIVITMLFAFIYKYLPDTYVSWRDVWVGAALTSALFTIGKYLIGLYLGRSSLTSAYGAAASIVILMVWVYYAAQVFFYGAELTHAYARHYGSRARRAGREAEMAPQHPVVAAKALDGRDLDQRPLPP